MDKIQQGSILADFSALFSAKRASIPVFMLPKFPTFSTFSMFSLFYLLCEPALAASPLLSSYQPSLPSYDFTTRTDRWGQNIDKAIQKEKRVGKIYINPLPIFDTDNEKENNAIYRWANGVHIYTKKKTLEDLLLFNPGDQISDRKLKESERILRDQSFVKDAAIRVVRDVDDVVDLEVITREVWTLVPDISVKNTGGDSSVSVGLTDSNFLGYGKKFGVSYRKSRERDRFLLSYKDKNFLSKRILIRTHFEKNSDGYVRRAQFALPFFQLDAKRSWNMQAAQYKQDQGIYERGDEVSTIQITGESLEAYWGISDGLVNDQTTRFIFGYRIKNETYALSDQSKTPTGIPEALNLNYPFIEVRKVQDKFTQVYNVNQINTIEDLYTGYNIRGRLGYSSTDKKRVIFQGSWSDTLIARNKMILQSHASLAGRWLIDESELEDTRLDFSIKFHRGQTKSRSLVAEFNMSFLENPTSFRRLTQGGNNGLRGYDSYFLNGDTRFLFSIEERVFTDWEPFGLFNVGFAAFADTGTTYFRKNKNDRDWYSAVGIGLRLLVNKADKGKIVHIDLAYPIGNSVENNALQFSVELKKTL